MAEIQLKSKLLLRSDTETNWVTSNPSLLPKEIVFVKDKLDFKINRGDSATNFNNIDYLLSERFLETSGGTIKGTLVIKESNRTRAPGFTTLKISYNTLYCSWEGSYEATLSFHPLSSSISLNNSKLIGLAAPDNPTDAANKEYVDNAINTAIANINNSLTNLQKQINEKSLK